MGALLNDKRKIVSITGQTHDETHCWTVGRHKVTSIAVEAVNGDLAHVPWFCICAEGHGDIRLNGRFVYDVQYAP